MPTLTGEAVERFSSEIMPIPELAQNIASAVQAEGEELVPVALPKLEVMFFHQGQRFKIAEGVTRILFIPADEPLRVEETRHRELDLDGSNGWWHYYSDVLVLNNVTSGIDLNTNPKPDHGHSPLMPGHREYIVAGRLKNGHDAYDSEGHLPGHGPKLKTVETSISMTPGLEDELIGRTLVGWSMVKDLDMRRAAGKSILAHVCRTAKQIPESLVVRANSVWETKFDPQAHDRYVELDQELKAMKSNLGAEWILNRPDFEIRGA